MMKTSSYGLNLCKKYYEEVARPVIVDECPEIIGHAAFGLVGEGSECFGFDDEISRDHDWGPGFCIWLSDEDYIQYGQRLTEIYDKLPKEFEGYQRVRQTAETADRIGVMRTSDFYSKFIGLNRAPEHNNEWRFLPDSNFAVVTNGEVFEDGEGTFTRIRQKILAYYPEDVRKKKISHHAAVAAQSGQYNFYRCKKRDNHIATFQTKAIFIEHIIALVFLLNLKFCPYYKWASLAMRDLPVLGEDIFELIEKLCKDDINPGYEIEEISALVISEFKNQSLSYTDSDFLLDHAKEILSSIEDETLKYSHIMSN